MKRIVLFLVASVTFVGSAGAQDSRSDAVACADTTPSAGLYRRCALWDDGTRIRRGEEGVVVAAPRFLAPIAMTRAVRGDSAMAYARLYERRAKQGGALVIVGAALMGAGIAVLANRECQPTFIGCDYRDNGDWVAGSLYVPGLVLSVAGGITISRARRAKGRAIWWNNARFAQ